MYVCALVLGATTLWELFKVVSAFTIAHSLTLTPAAIGWLGVSSAIAGPVIATGIVLLAVQNLRWPNHTRGCQGAAAFGFGHFHGLGLDRGLL